MFWVLIGCTIVTIIVTMLMVYRMSQKPVPTMKAVPTLSAVPSIAPPPGQAAVGKGGIEAAPQITTPAPAASSSTVDLADVHPTGPEAFTDSSNKSMVYIYSDSCGWCERFNPTWKDFEDRYAGPLTIKKVEASDPEASAYNVSGYPTVLIAADDGTTMATFDSDRTVESLIKFAQKHE